MPCLALSVTIFAIWEAATLPVHLHYFDGGDRGNHGAPYRLLTAQREQLVLERDALDIEWRNLILEENALGDHSRVERIATEKLQMQHVDPSQENIVVQK